jgi:Zn-dependent peptidase ImmA (M78 family)/transcriptional regulator with XRE-family HTH domain
MYNNNKETQMPEEMQLASLLKKEREALGLTLKDVSHKLGFSHYQILSSMESGKRDIKAWELASLSKIYRRDINYFLFPEEQKKESEILWRNPEPNSQQEEVKRTFFNYCEKYKALLKLLGEKEVENRGLLLLTDKSELLNKNSFEYAAKKASDYLNLLRLGARPSCSLAKILEDKIGVKILYLNLPDGISGGSTISEFGMAILVNSNDAPWRRNFDLAHEFFHLITWGHFRFEQIYKKDNIERLANVFASAFLMPEDEIRREVRKRIASGKITYFSLIEIAQDFDVSIEALLWRLVNLGLLDKKVVSKEIELGKLKEAEKKTRNVDTRMRNPYLSPRYISLAIRAFHLGKISKAKLAEYVGKKFSEIPNFLKEFGYREGEDYSVEYIVT